MIRRVAAAGEQGTRTARRSLQPHEYAAARSAQRRFGSAAFGTITSAVDPRVVQLAVKLVSEHGSDERSRQGIGPRIALSLARNIRLDSI